MEIPSEKLLAELEKNLSFWLHTVSNCKNSTLYPEVAISGVPNPLEITGSMYLARAIYGASSAFEVLKNKNYLQLAHQCFLQLQGFQHPKGGYYWAKNSAGEFIHDAENNCMAQAFVLYGLVAFAKVQPSEELDSAIEKQFSFIQNTLLDAKNGGYIDGFNEEWKLGQSPTKALGTHIHLLEAFVSLYEYTKNENLVTQIEALISTILNYFITENSYDCLHRLTLHWQPLENEVWAGHNAEVSWILCHSAKTINKPDLINTCNNLAIKMIDQVLLNAIDKTNFGVFNVLVNNIPTEKVKIWWPQAETVLGLLNCYHITKDESYKLKAIELINFISTTFIAENGEWYTEIWNDKTPNTELPLVHFWKSMYHTVRYYKNTITFKN